MSASNGWDSYIWQIQNSYAVKKGSYIKMNVCQHAAIIGSDGTPWATTSEFPSLTEYDFELEGLEGSSMIKVNETKCALLVAGGNRNPTAAGVRLGGMKYVMVNHDPAVNLAQLSKQGGGGGAVMKTKNAVVIGMWAKDAVMTNNVNQSSGDCAMQVEKVANMLIKAGY